ncbi:MAG TPA: DUF2339 domain-containing protein [Gemmatimonadaceae bacterium]|nr:DUF2339 domain-containing protein [Gemmatimonadaceae bacterium]
MDTRDSGLLERIERLERSVAAIAAELQELRAATARQRLFHGPAAAGGQATGQGEPLRPAAPATEAPPRGPEPPPWPAATHPHRAGWTADEVEGLIGRYGMLGLATLTGLAAVGTFLGWAITQGLLGPSVRVLLGLLFAAGLAAAGAWIRPRERSFGAALLGIALAVVHVCGWAASPAKLALVSAWTALGATVLASAALAAFAHREDDEPLWCVGFGGAAVAPFITGGDSENLLLLTLYGGAVLLAGSWALERRDWRIAGHVLTASAALFIGALLAAPHRTGAPLMALGLAIGVAALGVLPFASPARLRGRLRVLGAMAAAAAFVSAATMAMQVDRPVVMAAIGVSGLAWLLMLHRTAKLPAGTIPESVTAEGTMILNWIDAAVIPLAFLLAGLVEVDGTDTAVASVGAAGAVAMAAFVMYRRRGTLRDAGVFALCIAVLVAAFNGAAEIPQWRIAVMAAVAVGLVLAERWRTAGPWYPVAAITLIACSMAAHGRLTDRVAYAYTPMLTHASALAAIVAAAWFAFARASASGRSHWSGPDVKPFLQIAAWAWAFLWVHQELYDAFSPTISTLLLITYYAATSVLAVWVGRTRGVPGLRHLGLVLALVASAAAARGAAHLDAVWARIAGYLVTSAFLLALAWWYRGKPNAGGGLRDAGVRNR